MKCLILMYHDLSLDLGSVSSDHRPYMLNTEVFEKQMNYLYEKGFWVTSLEEVLTHLKSKNKPLETVAIVPTFDDGHISNYSEAFPILQRFGFKGTFFITVGFIGSEGYVSWNQVREMQEAGMEIGSHTLTHPRPIELSEEQLRFELLESKRLLDLNLPRPICGVSSPTGFYNPKMSKIARETGYQYLCFGRVGVNDKNSDSYALKRTAIKSKTSFQMFCEIVNLEPTCFRKLEWNQYGRDFLKTLLGARYYVAFRKFIIDHLM